MANVGKVFHTIRYMTPRQWRYRLYYTARNKLRIREVNHSKKVINPERLSLNYAKDLHKAESVIAADYICKHRFNTVSNIMKEFDDHVDWDLPQEEYRLVCFKLNSFRWLLDLSDAFKCTGEVAYIKKGFQLIDDWYRTSGDKVTGEKWNPYVIAERLMNWIGFCSEYCDSQNKDISLYACWIYEQANELRASLEYQLGANHLLSEGKALVTAGAFLKDSDLYKAGKKLLLREFKEQFLLDGGHYERSVSYHVESLQQYYEALVILILCNDSQASNFVEMLREPYRYLNGMISVSGNIPLFNDAAYDYPFYDATDFLATGRCIYDTGPPNARPGEYFTRWNIINPNKEKMSWDVKELYEDTGYMHHRFKCGQDEYSLFLDAADGGPDSNMGHAHADALAILLSSSQKDILVDSGVFTYKPGAERNDCRATKAHNTIEVDGKNSAEIWSAFRVAKRGHCKILKYEISDQSLLIRASHDGYRKCLRFPVTHTRDVVVQDTEIKLQDFIAAKHEHKAVSRFHIGPDCTVKLISDNTCMIDDCISIHSSLPMKLCECGTAELFGQIRQSQCIEIPFHTTEVNRVITTITIKNEE